MTDLSQEEKWKIYDASQHYIDQCNQRQWDQDAKSDKWILTLASSSFGLSFAFIDKIVPLSSSSYRELLLSAWACFAMVLILELCGFMISSFLHSSLANEERKNISLKYRGKFPKIKTGPFFSTACLSVGIFPCCLLSGGLYVCSCSLRGTL